MPPLSTFQLSRFRVLGQHQTKSNSLNSLHMHLRFTRLGTQPFCPLENGHTVVFCQFQNALRVSWKKKPMIR